MSKELEEIMKKAYETGALTDTEFRKAITDLFLEEYEYIIDTGNFENVNAEFVLRLKGKHRKLHKIFWNDKFAQEPKKYLKWEDLEFTNEVKEMKVKLGDNTYEIEYYICNALGLPQPVVILKTSDFIAITIEQFFNDLRLERVEE